MNTPRKWFTGLALAATGLSMILLTAPRANAETFNLRICAGHPPLIGYSRAAKIFFQPEVARRVALETPHKIVWVEAYGGSVAKLAEMIDAVQNGLCDVGLVAQPFIPSKMFLYNLASYVPFSESDPVRATLAVRRVFDEIPYFKENFAKQYGQKYFGIGTTSAYGLGTNFAWDKFSDLKGRKLAAAGSNLIWLEGTGAVPIQQSINEAYNAISTGIFEGYLIHPGPWRNFKLSEVAKHYKLVDFGAIPFNSMTINLKRANSLPPKVMQIIEEVAREWEMVTAYLEQDDYYKAQEDIKNAGANVTRLSEDERKKWAIALKDVPNNKAQEAKRMGMPGPQALKLYIKALKELGGKLPIEYEIQD